MRNNGWGGVMRAKKLRTTIADPAADRAPDLVKRQFKAARPDELWVADFTYVPIADILREDEEDEWLTKVVFDAWHTPRCLKKSTASTRRKENGDVWHTSQVSASGCTPGMNVRGGRCGICFTMATGSFP
jgi:transposase InsO family protein